MERRARRARAPATKQLLTRLLIAVAPAFVIAAASAPLLQGWFAQTSHDVLLVCRQLPGQRRGADRYSNLFEALR